jgi:hypothetical protein
LVGGRDPTAPRRYPPPTRDARIDRIARRVGINISSKEELFALTTTRYLAEICALLEAVDEQTDGARAAPPWLRGVRRLRHREQGGGGVG